MFYVIIFSILAVVLVAGGMTTMNRRRRSIETEEAHSFHREAARHTQKAKRAQSRRDRRKRH